MSDSTSSLRGLDYVNIFMADVKDGVGVYLSVYLLTIQKWDPSQIGIVLSVPFFLSIALQSPVGAFIDRTAAKRHLIFLASLFIALSCLTVIYFPTFEPILASQIIVGVASTIFHPCINGISLGIVGYHHISQRIGRNEAFNHFGNMLGAVASLLIAWFVSYEGIFYFSVFQCIAILFAIMMIREKDIDHNLARSAVTVAHEKPTIMNIRKLFSERKILLFTIAMGLFHFSNGSMLPLLGQKIGITDAEHSAVWMSVCIIIAQTVMTFVAPRAGWYAQYGRKNIFLFGFMLIPLRAFLFALIENKYALMSFQIIDGLSAGIFGVVSILMMADLSKGTVTSVFCKGQSMRPLVLVLRSAALSLVIW